MHVDAQGGAALIAVVAAELSSHGVTVRFGSAPETRDGVLLLDASSQAELDDISGCAEMSSTLWCGTAGLARALAAQPAPVVRLTDAPHLVIVGSHHPAARRQVDELARLHPDWLSRFDAEADASADRIHTKLAQRTGAV